MREQLNNNPLVQALVIGVLLLGAGFFLLTTMGGGGDGEEAESDAGPTEAAVTLEESVTSGAAAGTAAPASTAPISAPPPPAAVTRAYQANKVVVLLFVRDGAIDDELTIDAVGPLRGSPNVATFIVPASGIARYATITQGVAVDRVPALVVISPRSLSGGVPTASVQYGFLSPQSVVQAVVDAGYEGPTLQYHP